MGRKRHTPEQIITALREAEVGLEARSPGCLRHGHRRTGFIRFGLQR